MRGAPPPRLLLEVVCARLLLPSASDAESALLQRVERIETRLDMSIPASESVAPTPPRKRMGGPPPWGGPPTARGGRARARSRPVAQSGAEAQAGARPAAGADTRNRP